MHIDKGTVVDDAHGAEFGGRRDRGQESLCILSRVGSVSCASNSSGWEGSNHRGQTVTVEGYLIPVRGLNGPVKEE